jgi:hypothetical protein
MTESEWAIISSFAARSEYERFIIWLRDAIESGRARVVEYRPIATVAFYDDMWVQNTATGSLWQLAPPDGPFSGFFKPVEL